VIARLRPERGQAAVELVAGIPALVLGALIALQLCACAYALHLADGAAEAGALAVAGGADAEPAARAALPGWARGRVSVEAGDGVVRVAVRPPAPLAPIADALQMRSSAAVAPTGDG